MVVTEAICLNVAERLAGQTSRALSNLPLKAEGHPSPENPACPPVILISY